MSSFSVTSSIGLSMVGYSSQVSSRRVPRDANGEDGASVAGKMAGALSQALKQAGISVSTGSSRDSDDDSDGSGSSAGVYGSTQAGTSGDIRKLMKGIFDAAKEAGASSNGFGNFGSDLKSLVEKLSSSSATPDGSALAKLKADFSSMSSSPDSSGKLTEVLKNMMSALGDSSQGAMGGFIDTKA